MGPTLIWLVSLHEEKIRTQTPVEGGGHVSMKMALCQPRREASEESKPADALVSDFQPPELSEINGLFQPPSLWCLVMPTLENGYSVFSTFFFFFFLPFKLWAEHSAVVIFTTSQPGLILLFKLPARFIEKLVKKGEQFKLISLRCTGGCK